MLFMVLSLRIPLQIFPLPNNQFFCLKSNNRYKGIEFELRDDKFNIVKSYKLDKYASGGELRINYERSQIGFLDGRTSSDIHSEES